MAITAALVKELRESTGAGMMDAKKALTETEGDMDAAVDWLRTKGLAQANKKAGGFLTLSADEQHDFIEELDKAAFARGANKEKFAFYRSLKDWVTTGFFTSEAGMTQTGTYHPLPGPMREVTHQEWLEWHGWA